MKLQMPQWSSLKQKYVRLHRKMYVSNLSVFSFKFLVFKIRICNSLKVIKNFEKKNSDFQDQEKRKHSKW